MALTLLVTSTVVFNRYSSDSQDALINSQINKIGSEITHTAKKMYASGIAWETIKITVPAAVKDIKIYNGTISELVINYERKYGSEVVFFSDLNLKNQSGFDCSNGCSLNIKPGAVELKIESNKKGEVIIHTIN